jgi:hypothetical protein
VYLSPIQGLHHIIDRYRGLIFDRKAFTHAASHSGAPLRSVICQKGLPREERLAAKKRKNAAKFQAISHGKGMLPVAQWCSCNPTG